MKARNTMAIDQYGHTYHNLGPYPRKELCKRLYRSHVRKIYCDRLDGGVTHTGYIIAGLWLDIYAVSDWGKS